MTSERELALFMASVYYKLDRHNDSISSIKKMILLNPKLSYEERILFSHIYKDAVCPLRNTLGIIEMRINDDNSSNAEYIEEYKAKILNELENICLEFIAYTDNLLLPVTNDSEAILFYEKTKGDFYRYIAEFKSIDDRTEFVCKAKQCYENAVQIANVKCSGAESLYQGLFLNYCILLYDMLNQKMKAIEIASHTIDVTRKAYDKLYEENDCIGGEQTMNIQLLNDNLTIWKKEIEENQ